MTDLQSRRCSTSPPAPATTENISAIQTILCTGKFNNNNISNSNNSKVLKRGYNNNTKTLPAATPQNVKKFWKFEHIQKDLFFQAATRYELQTVWILLIVSQVLFNKLEPTVYNVDKTNNNFINNNACYAHDSSGDAHITPGCISTIRNTQV